MIFNPVRYGGGTTTKKTTVQFAINASGGGSFFATVDGQYYSGKVAGYTKTSIELDANTYLTLTSIGSNIKKLTNVSSSPYVYLVDA